MTTFVRFALIAACGIALSIHVGQLAAQPPGRGPQGPVQNGGANQGDAFSGKGTIQKIEGKRGDLWIEMSSAENQTWRLHCTKATKVKVVGTALPEYLKAGVHVRFSALADKKERKIKEEKIAKLTVFTPSADSRPGLLADPDAKDTPGDGDFKPYLVAGTIASVHGKTITMSVPSFNPKLEFELDESPQIDFKLTDVSLAKVGDSIEGQGTKFPTPQMQPQRPQQPMQRRPTMPGMYGRQGMGGGMPGQQGGPGQPGPGFDSTTPQVANLTEATITKADPLGGSPKKSSKLSAKSGHGKAEREPDSGFGAPPLAAPGK